MREKIKELQKIIDASENTVFFGGAGVSTESGIPDFRSVDGLYYQQYKFQPEVMLSRSFYEAYKKEFYNFYRNKMICYDAKPNIAHIKLAEMERAGKLKAVITQNIDGLHQQAGSVNVIELHGCINRNICQSCGSCYDRDYVYDSKDVPECVCGGDIKPDVVLYEEQLKERDIESAMRFISKADVLIVGGTSLVVYPAAGLIDYFRGSKLILINKSETGRDKSADLVIRGNLADVMDGINVTDTFNAE